MVKNLPAIQETRILSLDWEDLLEKGMATHPSVLAWRIPWTEEPGRIQSMGSQSQTRLSNWPRMHSKIRNKAPPSLSYFWNFPFFLAFHTLDSGLNTSEGLINQQCLPWWRVPGNYWGLSSVVTISFIWGLFFLSPSCSMFLYHAICCVGHIYLPSSFSFKTFGLDMHFSK